MSNIQSTLMATQLWRIISQPHTTALMYACRKALRTAHNAGCWRGTSRGEVRFSDGKSVTMEKFDYLSADWIEESRKIRGAYRG